MNGFWNEVEPNYWKSSMRPESICALPGYEWSGNTSLGGDRNVFFPNEGPHDPPLVPWR